MKASAGNRIYVSGVDYLLQALKHLLDNLGRDDFFLYFGRRRQRLLKAYGTLGLSVKSSVSVDERSL